MPLLSDQWEIIDMVTHFLEEKKALLGLAFVGSYGEIRVPEYPAVVIVPGNREKTLHAQQTFNIEVQLDLYVYHADLTLTKRERSKADLKLVADIETLLESDYGWQSDPLDAATRQVIFAYVSNTDPGALQPRADKSNVIISTKMTWKALTQRRFTNAN